MKASNLKRGDRFRFSYSEAEWSFDGRNGGRYRAVGVCWRNEGNTLYFSGQDVVRVGKRDGGGKL